METLTIEKKETTTDIQEHYFDLTEIINGEEIVPPSPFRKHQNISSNLYDCIKPHVKKNKLGKVYYSPLDVILQEDFQKVQPDLIFIKKENSVIEQDFIRGVPDMVCEIVSKGSHNYDTRTKYSIYEQFQIPEYWIVIPALETIEIFTIEDGKYQPFSVAEGEGSVKSKVIEGLIVDVKDVFED